MMNEIDKLVWPASAGGVGVMDKTGFNTTATIAKQFGVIKKAPSAGRVPHRPGGEAVAELKSAGTDVVDSGWKALNVKVSPGGK